MLLKTHCLLFNAIIWGIATYLSQRCCSHLEDFRIPDNPPQAEPPWEPVRGGKISPVMEGLLVAQYVHVREIKTPGNPNLSEFYLQRLYHDFRVNVVGNSLWASRRDEGEIIIVKKKKSVIAKRTVCPQEK